MKTTIAHTMRPLFLFVAFLLLPILCHAQDTLSVSPRVGKIIDAYEREYFGLFPQAGPFAEAVLVHQSGSTGNINVFIESDDGISRIVDTIARHEYYQLGKYIEEYEPILYRMRSTSGSLYLEEKYGALLRSYLLRRPRQRMDNYYTVTYYDNGHLTNRHGSLLYCDGMFVVLDPDPDKDAFTDAIIIPSNKIEEMRTSEIPLYIASFAIPAFTVGALVGLAVNSSDVAGNNTSGPTVGLVSGLAAGMFGLTVAWLTDRSSRTSYKNSDHWKFEVLPGLVEQQFFRHGLPPELRERLYPDE